MIFCISLEIMELKEEIKLKTANENGIVIMSVVMVLNGEAWWRRAEAAEALTFVEIRF